MPAALDESKIASRIVDYGEVNEPAFRETHEFSSSALTLQCSGHVYAVKPDLIRMNRKRRPARRNFPYFAPDQGSAIALLVRWKFPNQNIE
jgi:hypothetical protein